MSGIFHCWEQRFWKFKDIWIPWVGSGVVLKHRFEGPISRVFDSRDLWWALWRCLTSSQVIRMLLVQGHTLRTTGVETTHSGSPTCGAFKVTPVTTSAEGKGSWGSWWGDPPLGTSKINAAGGVSGDKETQVALKNRIFKNLILKMTKK